MAKTSLLAKLMRKKLALKMEFNL
ncbi:UNVERIFIED_CONTAM: hypothetical protein GTU68_027603 [Idotea baltica]|nr:hypothetical protein [Idotea baltica]